MNLFTQTIKLQLCYFKVTPSTLFFCTTGMSKLQKCRVTPAKPLTKSSSQLTHRFTSSAVQCPDNCLAQTFNRKLLLSLTNNKSYLEFFYNMDGSPCPEPTSLQQQTPCRISTVICIHTLSALAINKR